MDLGPPLVALFFVLLVLGLGIGSLVLWIWTIVEVARVPDRSLFRAGDQTVWLIVIVLAGVIGSIIYLIVGRPTPEARAWMRANRGVQPPSWGDGAQQGYGWPQGGGPPAGPGQEWGGQNRGGWS